MSKPLHVVYAIGREYVLFDFDFFSVLFFTMLDTRVKHK